MMGSRRQLAATLGRIYPYRAAKQQAPGVAATDAKGFPNKSGMTGAPDEPGITGASDESGMTGEGAKKPGAGASG
ncbi:MAG: hypothetical protein II434_07745 [Bacteroidales bacterium]|nr:hypothetical protein [Bacteroidales bacterium]